jgi:hypothetical protein
MNILKKHENVSWMGLWIHRKLGYMKTLTIGAFGFIEKMGPLIW